jgi:hypothetical protein
MLIMAVAAPHFVYPPMFSTNHVALTGIVAQSPNVRIHVAARRPLSFVTTNRRMYPSMVMVEAAINGIPQRFVLSAICAKSMIPTRAQACTMTDISCAYTNEYSKYPKP